jgi:hypothetical protein
VNGDTTTGEFCQYEYSSSVSSDKLFFVKKPMCKESIMKMRHAQKELRCFSCVLGEMQGKFVLTAKPINYGPVDALTVGTVADPTDTLTVGTVADPYDACCRRAGHRARQSN